MLNYGRFEKPEVRQNGGRNFDVLQSPQFLNFCVSGRLRVVTEVLWYHFCVVCTTESEPNQRSKFDSPILTLFSTLQISNFNTNYYS